MGVWNVDALLAKMSSHTLTEWMAYYELEPFGDELLDVHLARLEAILINANRGQGESAKNEREFRLWKLDLQSSGAEFFESLKNMLIGPE